MKNEVTWKAANDYAPKFLVPIGVLTIIFAITGFFVLEEFFRPIMFFLVLSSISIIPLTEWYLHKHFDKDGNPKSGNASDEET